MATVDVVLSDELTKLQATKIAIKTAIENKGQDLSGVPFTEYASKIGAIQGGSSEDAEFIKGFTTRTNMSNMFAGCTTLTTIPFIDTSNVTSMYNMFQSCTSLITIPLINTSKVTSMQGMFSACDSLESIPELDTSSVTTMNCMFESRHYALKTIPKLNTSNVTDMRMMFSNNSSIEAIPELDTKKVTSTSFMFNNCGALISVPELDLRSVTNAGTMFSNCNKLASCFVKNIAVSLQIGSGNRWGHLLTRENALWLCKECRTTTTANTLTFATAVYDDIEPLYVKLVPITDEMRAEDDLIDEKLPFEVCESTDEGAMTIASYMALKKWSIAK